VRYQHRYRILVAGELTDAVHVALKGWTVEPAGADTAVTGDMDQPALYAVLADIGGLGLELIEVTRQARVPGVAVDDDGRVAAPEPAPS
jgi:hypothetical protein